MDVRIDAARAVVGGAVRAVTLGVTGGRIAAVEEHGTELPARTQVLLGADVVLLPGLVDTHVHIDEPGHADWEGFRSATRAAAAGGITTLVDMPLDCEPVTTSAEALALKRSAAARECFVDVGFWGGVVPDNAADLAGLLKGGVLGFKCFLSDSGNPKFPPIDDEQLRAAMQQLGGLPLLVHAESVRELAMATAPAGRSYAAFLASRPEASEVAAVQQVVTAAADTGARAHVVHVSSAGGVAVLAAARAAGVAVSGETCPHYLTFDGVPDGATLLACCPPIRDATDALWGGLRDGTLSLVVSDHSPCAPAMKALGSGDFGSAWGGVSSLQLGLPLVWTQARARGFDLVDVVRWMCTAPADLAGLPDKGRIVVGADADLCVFDPETTWTVDVTRLLHRQPVSPYDGRGLTGLVRQTWLRGEPVGDLPCGRLLEGAST